VEKKKEIKNKEHHQTPKERKGTRKETLTMIK
jgi:hypothetical protein